ncbi:cytidylate kinase [Thermodesulfatator indicus DSM 15286]|uniref:Cytidylate kinase n=1 Tax=Thermodesulfatator indicus (strain DSM 15286 / JCM 11887 / CIR29812) TaxID=667014 RepID=F8ADP0_THEID|nr:(d)CMP kinase [Thermodesulfatator indicus]AEH45998.1 cytidylate kinase [Thermodesulfatator indicus DSM 15286]
MRPRGLLITIDGPAGAGKSTVAKKLAKKLGYLYLDTGAMYRVVALAAQRLGLDFQDKEKLGELARTLDFKLVPAENGVKVFLGHEDVSEAIRTPEIDRLSSVVARIPSVREALKIRQQAMGKDGGVIAEGRDMGSVVFPDAEIKFFITASLEARAKRRYEEQKQRGLKVSFEEVLSNLRERDERDSKREVAPLVVPEGALVIDTSGLTPDQVLEIVLKEIEKVKKNGKS